MAQESRSAKGGYGRLDRRRILDAGLALTAKPGVEEIRFRELGAELGADPTAVYRHFRNKRALVCALIEHLLTEVADGLRDVEDSADYLTRGPALLLETFLRHPAVGGHLADARPVGPAELGLAERILASMERMGLGGTALVEYYSSYSGFVLSFIAGSCRVKAASHDVGAMEEVPWLPEDVVFTEHSHPALSRYASELAAMSFQSTFHSSIAVIVRSAARAGAGT